MSTGQDAILQAKKTDPDLILMDVRLEGDIGGVEAAGKIKTLFNIPVIYLTAYSDKTTLQRAKITEPFGFLIKPFEDRELYTTIEMDVDRPTVYVDPQQISQVLANLITNAYQAMLDGGSLTFTVKEGHGYINLSISDTGPGIPPETIEHIFEPLFTTKSKGMGLGLALSKNFAEINGSSISVESIPGEGSTFILTFPTEN